MTAPIYSSADYLSALQSLLPRGSVWPREAESTQTKTLAGLAQIYYRTNLRANQVISEALPSTTFELLPEWEATLGLPDPCAGVSPTIQGRRSQVVTRFANTGGQSVAYIQQFALNLGFSIGITQFTPSRSGQIRAGQAVRGIAWAHAWLVTAPANTVNPFLAGQSYAGEPISSSGNAILECELTAIAPAHTKIIFNYSDSNYDLIYDAATYGELSTQAGIDALHLLIRTTIPAPNFW